MPQPTLIVVDGTGAQQTINTINPNGQATSANSNPVVLASDSTLPAQAVSLITDGLFSDQIGAVTAFTWNGDGTPNTITRNGRTKTFAWSAGLLTSITIS